MIIGQVMANNNMIKSLMQLTIFSSTASKFLSWFGCSWVLFNARKLLIGWNRGKIM